MNEKKCVSQRGVHKGEGKRRSERQREKWCDEKKRKEGKLKKKKKNRYKEMVWWKRCGKLAESFLAKKLRKNCEEKARERRSRQPKVRWTLETIRKWLLI